MKGLLFTYLLTYGGALVAPLAPFQGFLIYVCFAILKPDALWNWSVPAGNYSRIIAIALIVGWLLCGMGDWKFGRARLVVTALVAFWLWITASALFAVSPDISFAQIGSLSKIFLPLLIGMTLIDSLERVKQLAWVIVLSQGYLALQFNLMYLEHRFDAKWFDFAGLDNNGLSITMCAAIGLAFFLGLHSTTWLRKGVAMAAALLMSHFVLLSMSRGGMLGLVVMLIVAGAFHVKNLKQIAIVAVAGVMLLALSGPEVREEFSSIFSKAEADKSAASRLDNWMVCLSVMMHNPMFGVGLDNYPLVIEQYTADAGLSTYSLLKTGREAHTLWLQIGAETGFPGIAFLMSFYVLCAAGLWPIAMGRTQCDPLTVGLARGVIVSIAGFMVSAQFVSVEGVELPYYVAIVGAGVLKLASASEHCPGNRTLPTIVTLRFATPRVS